MPDRRISRLTPSPPSRTSVVPSPRTPQSPRVDEKEIVREREDAQQLATPGEAKYISNTENVPVNECFRCTR